MQEGLKSKTNVALACHRNIGIVSHSLVVSVSAHDTVQRKPVCGLREDTGGKWRCEDGCHPDTFIVLLNIIIMGMVYCFHSLIIATCNLS